MDYFTQHLPLLTGIVTFLGTVFGFFYKFIIQPLWDKHKEATTVIMELRTMLTQLNTKFTSYVENLEQYQHIHQQNANQQHQNLITKVEMLNHQKESIQEAIASIEANVRDIGSIRERVVSLEVRINKSA